MALYQLFLVTFWKSTVYGIGVPLPKNTTLRPGDLIWIELFPKASAGFGSQAFGRQVSRTATLAPFGRPSNPHMGIPGLAWESDGNQNWDATSHAISELIPAFFSIQLLRCQDS